MRSNRGTDGETRLRTSRISTSVGEGRTVGVSDDGKWVAAGTREGDVYILDSDGAVHFTARQTYDISQVYFGEDVSYVVTLSPELFRFSTARLDNIGLMTALSQWSLLVAIVLAILLAADLIALFPRSRMLAIRYGTHRFLMEVHVGNNVDHFS